MARVCQIQLGHWLASRVLSEEVDGDIQRRAYLRVMPHGAKEFVDG